MKEKIEKRIAELKQADAEACAKRWDMSLPGSIRNVWREQSNELTARRHELESLLSEHPNKCTCGGYPDCICDITKPNKSEQGKEVLKLANLLIRIHDFIDKCGYTWNVGGILKHYHDSLNNVYISHTARNVINEFKDELDDIFSPDQSKSTNK